ncbi:flagellar basal body rod protein FlgC [Salinarimonas ramus]|uniref:Flagellar basal-body rod protein FlgC n=1 Tax=Salinarimonas ramus TaxID=690164 RepID=A0A917Q9B2_9HYPH|nr:flagellar basal body rod protein FlgC [Salinarimonas ramus]GGK37297.1 flagellar basal-body rod protein FlgC [Salinarimonas ramus]
MDFLRTIAVAASGLKAQSGRMRVIAENIANADSTAATPGADPYRRRIPTFVERLDRELGVRTVELGRVQEDQSDFRSRFDPGHPAADEDGQVKLPNVSSLVESMDMREAQRSYEANLNLVNATRRMLSRTIDILRA